MVVGLGRSRRDGVLETHEGRAGVAGRPCVKGGLGAPLALGRRGGPQVDLHGAVDVARRSEGLPFLTEELLELQRLQGGLLEGQARGAGWLPSFVGTRSTTLRVGSMHFLSM